MKNNKKDILSFKESIEFMDVSKSFLYKLTSEGRITFFKPNNGKIYFRKEDLENWMMQNERKSIQNLEENLTHKIKNNGSRLF